MNIDIHAENISISREYPTNGRSITLRIEERDSITEIGLFINDESQWWALRNSLPKHTEYYLRCANGAVLSGDEADEYARAMHDEFLARKSAA